MRSLQGIIRGAREVRLLRCPQGSSRAQDASSSSYRWKARAELRYGRNGEEQVTKRDFIFIAEIIRTLPHGEHRIITAKRFADALANTNPNFNREKFLTYVGIENP